MIDLRQGDWREALADVEECDAVICDPPFSARIHEGQRSGSSTRKSTLTYDGLTEHDAYRFAAWWSEVTRHWAIIFADHLAARWWESAWMDAGWYVFAPVISIRTCPTPRLAGDGPTSACDYIVIARPRRRLPPERRGSRRGYYALPGNDGRENPHPGSKPMHLMRALVRDYTLPGDLICDPFAGSGTTLLAAETEGRRAIGAELDPDTHGLALSRLRRPREMTFDFEGAAL